MTRPYRLGQSRQVQDLDHREAYQHETRRTSKRRQQSAERLQTDIEAHDSASMLELPDPSPWNHLEEAILIQRHSQWVDLLLSDGHSMRASLAGKLKGVKLVVGDRVRYSPVPVEAEDPQLPQAQVLAVLPRRTLLKRGGIDDRQPWQLICANADELWVCASVVEPPLKPGLLERAYALALDAGLDFRILVTKQDQIRPKDRIPELQPFRFMNLPIHATSVFKSQGIEAIKELIMGKTVVLVGHSGVGKTSLINALIPGAEFKVGELSRYGTGRQCTTAARYLPIAPSSALIDTPGIRTLSVRGLDWDLLPRIFPEFPSEFCMDPMLIPDEVLEAMEAPERAVSLLRLWEEMKQRNPNQNIHQ